MVDLKELNKWEHFLDTLNSNCYAPIKVLEKALPYHQLNQTLNNKIKNENNLYYIHKLSAISLRYINDAWFWAHVLKKLTASANSITELCSGRSITIDLALTFVNYKNNFYKVDYADCEPESNKISFRFSLSNVCFNVLKETHKIPKSNIIILNHAIDDLYMGVWQNLTNLDYFYLLNNGYNDTLNHYWQEAMKLENEIYPLLEKFIVELPKLLEDRGVLIIRNYPSAYETNQKDLKRINFTEQLTLKLINATMAYNQLNINTINLKDLPLDVYSKEALSKTFYVLQKHT